MAAINLVDGDEDFQDPNETLNQISTDEQTADPLG